MKNETSTQHDQRMQLKDEPGTGGEVNENLLAHETRQIVLRKARRLVDKGLPNLELDDVAQSLHQALARDAKSFDAQKGDWLPFAERSLQYALRNLLRHEVTEKRDCRNSVSLHVTVKIDDQEGSTELAQLISRREQDARIGAGARDEVEQSGLRLDVKEFKASLTAKLRELADALERESILDISRRTGTPRSTLYDRLELLRRAAEDKGLSKYVG